MAPVDRSAQGLLAGIGGAAAGGQKSEPVPDAVGELGRAEAGEPGRGQLQRERDAVQALADDADGGQCLRIEDEARGGGEGPVQEQLGGGEGRDVAGGVPGSGTGSGATGSCTSPGTASASRLVAMI